MKAVHLPAQRAFLRYLETPGADPPLLWMHGWQCTSSGELLETAVQPALTGRRSLVIDFLGHGYSDRPDDFGYTMEDHADTILTLVDSLGLIECGIVGHSMGGTIAVHVAAARPDVVSLLVLAEGGLDIEDPDPADTGHLDGQSESAFVETGYRELLDGLAQAGLANPDSVSAAHLGITRSVDPKAIHREAASIDAMDNRALSAVLAGLAMPRWYLRGALSDPEPAYDRFLAEAGIGLCIVPDAGHAMGLQNPSGLAEIVARIATPAWGLAS